MKSLPDDLRAYAASLPATVYLSKRIDLLRAAADEIERLTAIEDEYLRLIAGDIEALLRERGWVGSSNEWIAPEKATAARSPRQPTADDAACARSRSYGHSWRFDGDDPYIACVWCGEVRDAVQGWIVREAGETNE